MSTNNTSTTTAREMAQRLTALVNNNAYKGVLPTDEERFIYKHGLAIASTLDALASENERLAKINHNAILDLVDDDDRVRASCARVLPQAAIDGDSYAVPGIAELCEMVVVKCETLASENERLREERSKLCYQLDHASTAIRYAMEAIDADDVICAHQRLADTEKIIENADAHKDEWESYR